MRTTEHLHFFLTLENYSMAFAIFVQSLQSVDIEEHEKTYDEPLHYALRTEDESAGRPSFAARLHASLTLKIHCP